MSKKITGRMKMALVAGIVGTSILVGLGTSAYAEDGSAALSETSKQNGWVAQDNAWYYYQDGVMQVNSWVLSGGKYYYMGTDGTMQTNTWIGNYYVDVNGVWLTNYRPAQWVQSGSKWWYRNEDGSYPANAWKLIDGKWYYFDGSGYMVTGWKGVGGKWYYFSQSGVMQADAWVCSGGKYYHMGSDGAMQTNTWIGDYYVDSNGVWIANYKPAQWVQSGSKWWYRNEDGSYPANAWKLIDGEWYYFDGSGYRVEDAWRNINGLWYYFDEDGMMLTGRWTINGVDYCFDTDGCMHTGWYKEINKWADDGSDCIDWLYFNEDGSLHTGWLSVGGKKYWTGDYGYLVRSFPERGQNIAIREIDGEKYGFDENGVMVTGRWKYEDTKYGNSWNYCFDEQGKAVKNGWFEDAGKWYYVVNGYVLVNISYPIDGVTYNFDEDGVATAATSH